jgi:hypothetical protein
MLSIDHPDADSLVTFSASPEQEADCFHTNIIDPNLPWGMKVWPHFPSFSCDFGLLVTVCSEPNEPTTEEAETCLGL